MKRILLGILLWLVWLSAALAQYVTPVQMRDANLTLTTSQNFVTTLNTFSAQRTLTIAGAGGMNAYYLQFVDTANAINGSNTLRIVAADGSLINGSSSLTVSVAGVYIFIVPSPTGYSATVVSSTNATPPGGTSGQIQYNAAGVFGGFTTGGDATINTSTGILTLANVNSNTGTWGSAALCSAFTVNAKGLITAAAQSACTPAIANVTGLGTGVATFLATPSSANLAAALTDETGTGSAVFANGPTLIAPILGTPASGNASNLTALNATQLTSGTIPAARTNGHQNGTATNDNAAAGEIGEYISSTVASGSAVALTSGVQANVTSISLTAGDWDITGSVFFSSTSTTSFNRYVGGISTTSATIDATPSRYTDTSIAATVPNLVPLTNNSGPTRFSFASTTTVYLVALASFTVSTSGAYGIIRARRVR